VSSVESTSTESLCPECLRRIPAFRISEGLDFYLLKTCPEHGTFKTIIWRGPPGLEALLEPKTAEKPSVTNMASSAGCPLDCGLCPEHAQQSCCVLLEVTARCDLGCPVCFASAGEPTGPDPDLGEIERWYRLLQESAGTCNVQLSGGEPTMRDDLPEIIAMGRSMGFSFIQVNTNGMRLSLDPQYARSLKDAGLSTVFLQFDGLDDRIYRTIRGRPLLEIKQAAIKSCAEVQLGVVLVPTLIPGVNTGEVGRILEYAMGQLPHVRGVHFQPVSYFGRYPTKPGDEDRYTLPELMRDIELQSEGLVSAVGLHPSGCEHSLCSFHGYFVLMPDGSVRSLTDDERSPSCCGNGDRVSAVERARNFVARRWSLGADSTTCCDAGSDPTASWDAFLARVRGHGFTVTAMAFQDVWNLDLERLRNCCLHVVSPDLRIVPFCSYNLTSSTGESLHRRVLNAAAIRDVG